MPPASPNCIADDPSLASSRDLGGVSAIMLSRYRFNRATTDALLAADPELDVFEATALGYIDRLRERLTADPASATAFSPDGFTALHYAGFFGKVEAARELIAAGASVDVYTRTRSPTSRCMPRRPAGTSRSAACCSGPAPMSTPPSTAGYTPLHEAAQSGDVELDRALPVGGCRSDHPERRSGNTGRDRRGRRAPRPGGADPGSRRGSAEAPRPTAKRPRIGGVGSRRLSSASDRRTQTDRQPARPSSLATHVPVFSEGQHGR